MSWTAQAGCFAEDLREIGQSAANLNAAAWSAGVMPEATQGIVGAALALHALPSALYACSKPLRSDHDLLTAAQDIEATVAEMLKQAAGLWRRVADDLEMACEALAAASAAVPAGATQEEADAAQAAAEAARAEAMMRIADCDTALEIINETGQRLKYALACLSRVPDDLEGTYEAPYQLVRAGRALPYEGEWLTGATPDPSRHTLTR
jgi:hypothetical protein